MKRLSTLIALLVVALAGLPALPQAAAEPEPDFISVNPRGSVPVERDGDVFVWTADLFSLRRSSPRSPTRAWGVLVFDD